MTLSPSDDLRAAVRARYSVVAASAAVRASDADPQLPVVHTAGCCAPGDAAGGSAAGPAFGAHEYAAEELAALPSAAVLASLGCGNPTALAELRPGEVVLDLGSGGGIDVLLSAQRVGPTGFAYGVDMTEEMLALAERNAAEHGVYNVRFLKGQIEALPLPDQGVDVVISNCVINLSPDKAQVLREAFRVLKPGGRFAVSDVVVQGALPADIRRSLELWAGCIAGALEEADYQRLLAEAGFEQIDVQVTRVYDAQEVCGTACGGSSSEADIVAQLEAAGGRLVSAFIRATRPARSGG